MTAAGGVLADQQILISTFLVVLDLLGTFVFALSGAASGIKHRLDLFGVLVVAFAAANAGGITRDLLIGAVPPAGISDWRYIAVSALAGSFRIESRKSGFAQRSFILPMVCLRSDANDEHGRRFR